MKLQVLAAFVSLVLSTGAFAGERYLVVMKSGQSYNTAHLALTGKANLGFKGSLIESMYKDFSKVDAKVVASLKNINTLVLDASASEIAKLQASSGVAMVEKEIFHPAPKPMKGFVVLDQNQKTPPVISNQGTPWGIGAVKAPEAWKESNQGAGTRVMVLDTGIDGEHPSLKANYEKGKDFTGSADSTDVTDLIGHGTHVAGTIAGVQDASGFTGVAPQAKILAGRVCGLVGCSNVAIAQGINWGIEENVDVISMSLGGMWSTPAERAAVAAADAAGVTVVAASGNDGRGVVSYPAALPTVIAVGAINSKLEKADFSQYGPELAIVAPGVDVISAVPVGSGRESEVTVSMKGQSQKVNSTTFQGAKELDKAVDTELVYAGLGKPEDFAGKDFTGKFALVSRGEISFMDKINNAMAAKALGVIVYNNAPGLIHGALTQDGSTLDIAVAMIEQTVGLELKAALEAGDKATAAMVTLKTDYSSFDGTSMATPHVSGVVALVKAANKSLKPADVKQILQTTAQVLGPNTQNEFGAGLVNAEAAVHSALSK